jgi:hypothetical protein
MERGTAAQKWVEPPATVEAFEAEVFEAEVFGASEFGDSLAENTPRLSVQS